MPTRTQKKQNINKEKEGAWRKGNGIASLPALLVAVASILVVWIFASGTGVWSRFSGSNELGPSFEVVSIPGRGKGVVAKRNIKQGELLIKEHPLFIVPKRLKDQTDPRTLIQTTVASLSPADQSAFFALSYAKPNVSSDEIPFEVFQTNAISAGSTGTGLFPNTARLNHGCSRAFGAVYHWREEQGVLVVHAIRDIKKGQEILTTYTDTKRPRSERRAYLREIYHFDCACAVCSLSEKESNASDRRLGLMTELRSRFATWGKGEIKGTEAIKLAKRIWAIGEKEGYISERGQLASDAAYVAAGHSDADAVRQWAALAYKWFAIELGPDSHQCRTALSLGQMPESHGAWGSRESEQVAGTEGLS